MRLGLLHHKETESLNMLHIHCSSLGGIFHFLHGNNEIIPPMRKSKLLIETIIELHIMFFMMDIMNAAINDKPGNLRIINTAAQRLIAAPVVGKIKKSNPGKLSGGQLYPNRFLTVSNYFTFLSKLLDIDPSVSLKGCFEIRENRKLPGSPVFVNQ